LQPSTKPPDSCDARAYMHRHHQEGKGGAPMGLHPGAIGATNAYMAGALPPILPAPPANSESVLLVTAGYDHTIRFWQAWQGDCQRIIQHAEGQVNRLAISPDRRFLAVAANQAIRIYDCSVNAAAANLAGLGHGNNGAGGAGTSGMGQGGSASAGGASGVNNPVVTFTGHTSNVTSVCWQQDSKWLASSSEDGTVRVWDLRLVRPFRSYPHQDPVNDVVVHPNQGELISCDDGGRLRIWDLAANACTLDLAPEPDVPLRSVTVPSDASCLVAGNNNGTVFLWKMLRGSRDEGAAGPLPSSPPANGNSDGATEAERDPRAAIDGTRIGPRSQATAREPHQPAAGTEGLTDDPTATTSGGFAPKQPSLLVPTSSVQHQADPPAPEQDGPVLIPAHSWQAHSKYLIRALISPDMRYLATCGADTTIKIWNMDEHKCSLEKTLLGHQRWVWDLAFSADSNFLVSASSDHVGRLWDISTGETVRTYTGHDKAIVAVALNDQAGAKAE